MIGPVASRSLSLRRAAQLPRLSVLASSPSSSNQILPISTVFSRSASVAATAPSSSSSLPSVSNIEASWKTLAPEEQDSVFKHLEELQKKDWKELTLDEKKAAYYVSFGPHGPREPIVEAGHAFKTLGGVTAVLAVTTGLYFLAHQFSPPPPKTITREWQEASNERALEQKQDPFTGPASEGYSGKGYVTKK